jgi:hypothetical protein
MNVGEAFKWHGNKIQAVEDDYCMNALSTPNTVTTENVAMVRAVEGYRSWKKAIRICQQQCNGINIEATKRCPGKEKVRERLTAQNKPQILSFRTLARMMDDGYNNLTQAINAQKGHNVLIYDCRTAIIVNDEIITQPKKKQKKMTVKRKRKLLK